MKTRRSRLNAQSPNKPKLLAEKGGRIFARVRDIIIMYNYACIIHVTFLTARSKWRAEDLHAAETMIS